MSLVELYDALKEANVSDQKAIAAVESLEVSLDEPWLRSMEERMAKLEGRVNLLVWMVGFNLALNCLVLAIVLRLAFGS